MPPFIDWSNYRTQFEREASRLLGRQVTVSGQAQARLLPFPSVRFTDVSVAGTDGGEPVMTADSFSMDAELSPFLRGEILIFDMRLEKPKLTVSIDNEGILDWAIRPQAPAAVKEITLEQVRIMDGEVTVIHAASGSRTAVEAINATVSAETLQGPWRVAGTGRVEGHSGRFVFSTGTVTEDGRIRLRSRIEPDELALTLEADGRAALIDGAPRYSGTFTVGPRVDEPEKEGEAFSISVLSDNPWTELRLAGEFTLENRLLAFDTIRLESGPEEDPYTAEGTGFIDLGLEPRFALKLEGRQVQLAAKDTTGSPVPFPTRVAAFRAFLDQLPQPPLPGTIDMSLPAVVAGDTTIRDLSFAAQPRPEGWNISRFSAHLPGRTTLEASGLLSNAGTVSFDGNLLLAIAQPSGFAAWLTDDVDEAIRRLGSAGFSGAVNLSQNRQSARDLEIILGGAKFTGLFDRVSPEGEKAATVLELEGQALDVEGFRALAALFFGEAGEVRLARDDLDLKLKAGPVHVSGTRAEAVDLGLRLKEGTLDIDRFAVRGLEGADLSATGRFEGFPEIASGSVDASIAGRDLNDLADFLANRYPDNVVLQELVSRADSFPGLLTGTRIDFTGRLDPDSARLSGQGRAGGTSFDFRVAGARSLLAGEGRMQLSVTAANDEGEAVLAAWGVPVLPIGLAGRVETGLQMNGTPGDGFSVSATVSGPTALLRVTGDLRTDGNQVRLTGNGEVKGEDLAPWLMAAGYGIPGAEFGLPVVLEAPITLMDGVLGLAGLEGHVAGQGVTGVAELRMEEGRPRLTGSLKIETLAMDWIAGLLLGSDAVALAGTEAWPDQPFTAQGQVPINAGLTLEADKLTLAGLLPLEDVNMRLTAERDRIRISDLDAGLAGGRIQALVEVANASGSATVSSQLSMSGANVASLYPEHLAAGVANVSANISGSGKTPGSFLASLSGSGSADVAQVVLEGFNTGAYPEIVDAADAIGPEIDQAAVSGLAVPLLKQGSLRIDGADFAFTVAGGVVRSAPVRIQTGEATLTAEFGHNLATGQKQANGNVVFDPGEEALAGSEPVVRFAWDSASGLDLDISPLTQYLTQRALEREQARVEAMQALLLEKQRLRREAGYFAALASQRDEIRAEEERRQAEEDARRQAEEEQSLQTGNEPEQQIHLQDGAGPSTPSAEPDAAGSSIIRRPIAPAENQPGPSEELDSIFDRDAFSIEQILRSNNEF